MITWISLRNGASGARQGVSSKSVPVVVGIQYRSETPLPLNQSRKRVSGRTSLKRLALAVAAYAVPLALNMASRKDSATATAARFSSVRREILLLAGMSDDY